MRRSRPRGAFAWIVATVAALAILAWAFGAYWIGALMFAEHNPQRAGWTCEKPAYVYGTSTWQWWPPGRVCRYHDGTIGAPSDVRSVVIVVLAVTAILGGTGLLVYERRGTARPAERISR
jgi:hypothetical protein